MTITINEDGTVAVFSDHSPKLKEINDKLDKILGRLGSVTPELERAVREVAKSAKAIDKQVPDKKPK